MMEFFPGDGGFRGEDADGACLGKQGSRLDRRLHAHEGDWVAGAQGLHSIDGGRVAGDHDDVCSLGNQLIRQLKHPLLNQSRWLAAIGAPGGIADVADGMIPAKASGPPAAPKDLPTPESSIPIQGSTESDDVGRSLINRCPSHSGIDLASGKDVLSDAR